MKNKVGNINTLMNTFSVFLIITGLDACKLPKMVNNRTICFKTHNSWSAEDNAISVKIDSITDIWHYLTYTKKAAMPHQLKSFLKGDYLECDNWVDDTHWSISCKGQKIEIFKHKSQLTFELEKETER
jgi:hypothetical protein